MKSKKHIIQWYVEPIGSYTNKHISELLGQRIEENICQGVRCFDGIVRDLIRVTAEQLVQCIASKIPSKLTFNILAETEEGICTVVLVGRGEFVIEDENGGCPCVIPDHVAALMNSKIEHIRASTPVSGTFPFNALRLQQSDFNLKIPTKARTK